ncbi:CDP-alcohol phosphatidyltransferase family protein [Psychromarinibacter halotolerans]|uniref:CDP-alcohol phosphatidyltransferase family protein n=1 Tax=Psychromarinibacter halotolerans TaxID=1775175 RepID=A0ABV7GV50_9RHOB|nr:CDP-alcohol phosphatidyltransferase family protein [Psychromarinibacter halotolerans]MDF0594743.1 CDP-alcohol phosphatidyltransferase family protein [Psychromarinibacter halotolerans]
MTAQEKPSFGRIAADLRQPWFREELRTAWSIALLYRVPSLPVVWIFARLGLSPVGVSFLALAVALAMPLLAWGLPLAHAPWAVALAGALFQVLDCADGTLARVTGRTSKTGGDLDFLVDMTQWGLLYLAIGLLADRVLGADGWATLAAMAGWVRLLARVIRDRLQGPEDGVPGPLTPADWLPMLIGGISGLIPILALTGDYLGWAVWALMIYSLLDVAEGLLPLARDLRR